MSPDLAPLPFVVRNVGGGFRCQVCRQNDGHRANCGVVLLEQRLRDLAAELGAFVLEVKDTLDGLEDLLNPGNRNGG